ncbi:PAS domain-containing protein [Xanthomonas melonis]|uniref:histidine kinase n=2 Tax=Xanthomonas melonis TaxID=56456 RepID=A0ABS8NQ58_9XANT|nr:PAS domain-containing protein [Xanthomonas melonis]MCD0256936.1 PAS domain-containing protein [Xanthomonas melonis]MCD0265198.1 PAS domain-containing protein [Xanthomonas melonis]
MRPLPTGHGCHVSTVHPVVAPSGLEFLSGGGVMGATIRAHDWAATPLGAPQTWPQSLRSALSMVLNARLLGAVLWGPQLRLLYNDVYLQSLGDRHPHALGQPVAEVWGDTYAPIAEDFARVMRTGEGYGQGVVALPMLRNGVRETTYWNATASPIRGEDGSIVGLLNIAIETTAQVAADRHRDIQNAMLSNENTHLVHEVVNRTSERDRALEAETAARRNAERVQLALAAGAIIGTWIWDVPNDAFSVDEAFAENFGFDPSSSRTDLPMETVLANVHPDDRDGLRAAIGEALARGGAYAHQYRVRRRDGNYYWLEANGRVERAPDGTPLRFPGVLLDIDARHALSEERDRALVALRELSETLEQRVSERTGELMVVEEALRQSQKMEAVGQLTGGLAHDFNNLLAGISGALELMTLRVEQQRFAELPRYLGIAQSATTRAAALTHRLLAFARRQTLLPKPTDVTQLIADILELVQRTVGPGIRVENVPSPLLWPALVDASQLENALLNLCINARDAMPDGGRLRIDTSNHWIDHDLAQQLGMREGPYLSLCVSDTGTGMPPDVVARAFDPFFTTKPLGEGTGLGLSMIYGFAKQSGGQVRLQSEVGKGSRVCIYLPRHLGDAARADTNTPLLQLTPTDDGETVLIVDDEPAIRQLLGEVLQELGYTVIEAGDSAAGLEILQSGARIDLLISDVGLPGGMNGRQMADASRAHRPDLKVLFITGFAESALLDDHHLEPRMAVLTKPFSVSVLTARVKELIATQG